VTDTLSADDSVPTAPPAEEAPQVLTYDPPAGEHVRDAIANARELATAHALETGGPLLPVTFTCNGHVFTCKPPGEETYEEAKARFEAERGFPVLTREEEDAQVAKLQEEIRTREAEAAAAMAFGGYPTEQELRDADVPWPASPEGLAAYVKGLVDRPHDYGTCVYAMSMAAVAAMQYVARELGVSGFQGSCAEFDVLSRKGAELPLLGQIHPAFDFFRRSRRINGPFMVVRIEDALYPQTGPLAKVREALAEEDTRAWLRAEALKLLAAATRPDGTVDAHPAVVAHWRDLAGLPDPDAPKTYGEAYDLLTKKIAEIRAAPEDDRTFGHWLNLSVAETWLRVLDERFAAGDVTRDDPIREDDPPPAVSPAEGPAPGSEA
jgi:hypothetical protein